MKTNKWFGFLAVVVVLLVCGCEDNGRNDPHQNDYGYNGYYNDQSTVTVYVRNDYWAYIGVLVGNALVYQVPPGASQPVSRNLIGNEKLRISILFYDQYFNPTVRSEEISFNRDYDTYDLVVRSPDDIQKF